MQSGQHAGVYRIVAAEPTQNEEWQWRIFSTRHLAIVKQALTPAQHGAPIIRLRLTFDSLWRPTEVIAERDDEADPLRLLVRAGNDGQWRYTISDAQHDRHASFTLDADMHLDMWTPQTNTATINRLQLAPGQSADIRVVYIEPRSFAPRFVRQRYTRLDDAPHISPALTLAAAAHYRYESLTDAGAPQWTGDIWTDADGLVIDYPGLFELIRYEPPLTPPVPA